MGQIIALDSMIFIYLFEADERFFEPVTDLFDKIESGKFKAVTSVVSAAEALSTEKYLNRTDLVGEISSFFQEAAGLIVMPVNWEIAQIAAGLRRENRSLRMPDAIQLATATVCGADSFITNDKNLNKIKVSSVKVRALEQIGLI